MTWLDWTHQAELIPTGAEFGPDDAYDCFYANRPIVAGEQVHIYCMGGDLA